MRNIARAVPVVDLFAGPGGLGEGFAACRTTDRKAVFRIALSIEKDDAAHQTLELRSFFRQFAPRDVPDAYYDHLRGSISRDELYAAFPEQAAASAHEAWKAELGKTDPLEVDRRIRAAVNGSSTWVLCGGPPCQPYSVIGRSRNGGIDAEDHRVFLYKEYLRILSAHQPPFFILENVKGLLSSRVGSRIIFKQMTTDLSEPQRAVAHTIRADVRYALYSITVQPRAYTLDTAPEFDFSDFVTKCEDYGVPQSRHRVILLGVRQDSVRTTMPTLRVAEKVIPAGRVLRGLPRLRSGLSRTNDGRREWREALGGILAAGALQAVPNGRGRLLRSEIRRTIERLRDTRADRGGEFVPGNAKCHYMPEWYSDERLGGVCNHVSRPHMKEDLYRYLFAACYARLFARSPELRDFPPALLPKHRNVLDEGKQEYFDDRFRVQIADRPATTVTSHMAKDGHYYIHFDETQCRSLTVREAARLQTFPDNYLFCGSRTQQYVQVGNAVPPFLAYQIAGIVTQIIGRVATTDNYPAARAS